MFRRTVAFHLVVPDDRGVRNCHLVGLYALDQCLGKSEGLVDVLAMPGFVFLVVTYGA